jgi:hypothetical protein
MSVSQDKGRCGWNSHPPVKLFREWFVMEVVRSSLRGLCVPLPHFATFRSLAHDQTELNLQVCMCERDYQMLQMENLSSHLMTRIDSNRRFSRLV